ncbi:MAG: methylmalonyl-CoA mutase, partial [Anaerolineae bacterium]|nr:methylmalonyl-CoA mutase [Anaerolineae bacterium]
MSNQDARDTHRAHRADWEATTLKQSLDKLPERRDSFITQSSVPIERVYSPVDIPDFDHDHDLGLPGEYPFTRGIHATGHRGRLWTMRMFAGF